jgi:hypothetical protein
MEQNKRTAKATKTLAMCGLDCAACPASIAYRTNDQALRVKTAAAWSKGFKVELKPDQNLTDPGLGDLGLTLLERKLGASTVRDLLVRSDQHPEYRQLLVIDAAGDTAHYSGSKTLDTHAYRLGADCSAAGNLLSAASVPEAMVTAFSARPDDDIAVRLLAAVDAGLAAGGEFRQLRSAGLIVVDKQRWPIVDLRVDEHDEPLSELRRLWTIYEPLRDGYVARATDPQLAVLGISVQPRSDSLSTQNSGPPQVKQLRKPEVVDRRNDNGQCDQNGEPIRSYVGIGTFS